jgi:hypothetical protein
MREETFARRAGRARSDTVEGAVRTGGLVIGALARFCGRRFSPRPRYGEFMINMVA